MLLKLIIFFLLFPSVLMAQNIKPLIVTDNASNTCNTARMIFSPGSVSCSGSNATVIGGGGSGTVTAISVASTNGFTGTSSGGATPALTLATSVTGPIKGNGTAISAAASADIIGLFSTCSGTQYLGADGACHTAGGGSSQWTTTNTQDVYLPSSGNVGIGTSFTTTSALTVMNGNVGIGTWKPQQSLNIMGGNVGIGTWVSSNNENLAIYSNVSSGLASEIGFYDSVVGLAGEIAVNATSGAPQLFINFPGVSSGSSAGGNAANFLGYRFNGANNKWFFGDDGSNAYFQTVHPMYFTSSSGSLPAASTTSPAFSMVINNGGNVGIGVNPQNRLDVSGAEAIGAGYAGANTAPSNGLAVQGNVGIGTWIPAYSLDLVNNKSRSRSVFRVVTTTQSATPTINTDTGDIFEITGLAQAITSMTTNLSGTPLDGDQLEIIFTDNGTARALTFGTSFESTTVTLPTTTVISTPLKVFLQWNAVASKWDCVGTA